MDGTDMLGPPGCPERSKDAREGQVHLRQETVKVMNRPAIADVIEKVGYSTVQQLTNGTNRLFTS